MVTTKLSKPNMPSSTPVNVYFAGLGNNACKITDVRTVVDVQVKY